MQQENGFDFDFDSDFDPESRPEYDAGKASAISIVHGVSCCSWSFLNFYFLEQLLAALAALAEEGKLCLA